MADYLSQGTLRLLTIGIVCIAAISVGAATITSTVGVGGSGAATTDAPGEFGDDPVGAGDDDGDNESTVELGTDEGSYLDLNLERCNEFLASIPGTVVYFGAAVGLVYLIKRRYSTGLALLSTYGLAPVALTAYFLGTSCPERGGQGIGTGDLGGGEGSVGDSIVATPDVSPVWLLGVFGVLLLAAAAVMIRASGDQTVEVDPDEEAVEEADVADLAAAAGAAADRLEEHNADVDNAVYRAWWEMTRLLDVENPESATPGEFAAAAVSLGIEEGDVAELTKLFEEVRYGQRDPESREELAIEVFRSIEAEYGDGEASLEPDDSDGDDRGGEPDGR